MTSPSPSPRCSTRCGSGARTIRSAAAWPGTSTSNSTAPQSIPTACGRRPRRWRVGTPCCASSSCPTARSGSPRRTSAASSASACSTCASTLRSKGDSPPSATPKSHQQLDGAVFELAVTLLPGERSRLHVDLDMQAADAMSYRTLMADLAALYRGRDLPRLGYSYPAYRRAVEAGERRGQPARDADREWWASASPSCPTRRPCRRPAPPPPAAASGAGTGWTPPPGTPCSPARGRAASPRRWRWPRPSPTPWRAGPPRRTSCSTCRCSGARHCTLTSTPSSATSPPRCCSTST